MTDKIYNHTEMTEITQYNVEDAETFMGGKKYVPVFHWLHPRPSSEQHPNPVELHEWYVEIGWPADTPWDTEMYDDEILAISGKEKPIHPDAIFVSPTEWTVKVWKTLSLSASVTPAEYEFPITWTSSDTTKATVTAWTPATSATVTGLAEWENIKITAKSWAVDAFAIIKVEKIAVTWVELNKSEVTLEPEATETLTVTVNPSDATYKTVTWSSSDNNVATVDWWVVTAVANGTATITVTSTDDNTKTATCTVTVETPVTGVELDESSIILTVWWTKQLTATISPETASDTAVTWSSSNTDIATVEDGLVTAVAAWEATITVTSHADWTITDDCSVTVNAAE